MQHHKENYLCKTCRDKAKRGMTFDILHVYLNFTDMYTCIQGIKEPREDLEGEGSGLENSRF